MKTNLSGSRTQTSDQPHTNPEASPVASTGKGGEGESISGPIGISSKPLSSAEQAAALAMLPLVEGALEARPRSRDEGSPPNEESNKPPQKLDDLLASALGEFGYRRVAALTYRADWSTSDVEHILTFDTSGRPKEFLTGDFGLRNKDSDAFAEQCQRRYADPIIRNSDFVCPPWWCWMHGSLGRLANWEGTKLFMPNYSQAELNRSIAETVNDHLLPYIRSVTTIDSLFHFLVQDTEPMRWFRSGGYFRAAEVAYLGRKIGITPRDIEQILLPYGREMRNGLDLEELTPEQYISRIIHDADVTLSEHP